MKPFFSCVMPVKGARPYMEEALASLRAQDMGEALEIIVQDGDVEPDCGQSDALNKGFAKARGEWLFWLNADDVLLPGALNKVKHLILSSDHNSSTPSPPRSPAPLNWIVGNTIYIDAKGGVKDVRTDAKWRPWFGKHMSVWTGGPSAFFRRELWDRYGGFDDDLKYVMDVDLWTRWARAGERFISTDDYLWGFRDHEGSTTFNDGNRHYVEKEFQTVLRKSNIRHEKIWRNVTRVMSVFDGTRWRRIADFSRFRGRDLIGCMGHLE